jgi:two-component system, NarL family, response regulator
MLARRMDFEIVGQACNGEQAVSMAESLKPDVVLMDLRMPVLDGFVAIERLVRSSPSIGILVISTYDGDEDVRRALRAGAKGYLLKDSSREQVWEAVRTVFAGGSAISPSLVSQMATALSKPQLTPRELEVLACLARGQPNRAIALALHISEPTVKTHINAILDKLGASSRTEAVVLAAKRGLVHDLPSQ